MDKQTKDNVIKKLFEANSEIDAISCILSRGQTDTLLEAGKLIDEVIEIIEREQ